MTSKWLAWSWCLIFVLTIQNRLRWSAMHWRHLNQKYWLILGDKQGLIYMRDSSLWVVWFDWTIHFTSRKDNTNRPLGLCSQGWPWPYNNGHYLTKEKITLPHEKKNFSTLTTNCLTSWLLWVTKREFLSTKSIQFQAQKWWD